MNCSRRLSQIFYSLKMTRKKTWFFLWVSYNSIGYIKEKGGYSFRNFILRDFFDNEKKENLTNEITIDQKTGSDFFCLCEIVGSR